MKPEEKLLEKVIPLTNNDGSLQYAVDIQRAMELIKLARMEEREIALKNQWISVKEQLPEPDKNVILSIQGLPVIGLGENVKDESLNITHWMAIPELKED